MFCLNNIVNPNLACGTQSPIEFSTGTINDICPILQFSFWELVYYLTNDTERHFPGTSEEKRGRYFGISENIGHSMTFLIITDDTNKRVERSVIRSAAPKEIANLREDSIQVDDILKTILKTKPKSKANNKQRKNHRYPTSGPSRNHGQGDIQPPSIDLKQEHKHMYDLRSLNADFEKQSFHFDKPSIAINDMDPFPVNSLFPTKEIPVHL